MHFLALRFANEIPSPYAQVYDRKIGEGRAIIPVISCPECGAVLRRGYFQPKQLVLKKGLLPDLLCWTDLYVSGRFRAAWEAEGLSGIDAFLRVDAMKMLGRRALVEEAYYLVVPSVSDVQLDVIKSRCVSASAVIRDMDAYLADIAVRSAVCGSCGRVQLSRRSGKLWSPAWKYPETWILHGKAGYDLLAPANMAGIYILSDCFVEFVKRNRLTNVYALTEAELCFAQENGDRKETVAFTPVYVDPEAMEAAPKRPRLCWREADCGSIACENGGFVFRDALDDGEAFALRLCAKAGTWRIERTEEGMLLRHEGSAAAADVEAGTLSIDAGAFYLRAAGKDRRAENRMRSALMEMGDADVLNNIRRMALSARRGVPAAFVMAEEGDGEYAVYVDNREEATAIRIGLRGL